MWVTLFASQPSVNIPTDTTAADVFARLPQLCPLSRQLASKFLREILLSSLLGDRHSRPQPTAWSQFESCIFSPAVFLELRAKPPSLPMTVTGRPHLTFDFALAGLHPSSSSSALQGQLARYYSSTWVSPPIFLVDQFRNISVIADDNHHRGNVFLSRSGPARTYSNTVPSTDLRAVARMHPRHRDTRPAVSAFALCQAGSLQVGGFS